MNKKNRILSVCFLLLLTHVFALAIGRLTPSETLQKVADGISSAKSVTCTFALAGSRGGTGKMVLSSDRFNISAKGYQIWYDGKTQWTLNEGENEVTVTEPTPSELEQINPFAILNSFRRAYDVSFASKSQPGTTTLVLQAKSLKAQISKVEITINSSTYVPEKIILVGSQGQSTKINITSFTKGGVISDEAFHFSAAKHPEIEINDMR